MFNVNNKAFQTPVVELDEKQRVVIKECLNPTVRTKAKKPTPPKPEEVKPVADKKPDGSGDSVSD